MIRIPHALGALAWAACVAAPATPLPIAYHATDLGAGTEADAVNDSGHVVGRAGGRAALWRECRWQALGRGPADSAGLSINNSDEVAGQRLDAATGSETAADFEPATGRYTYLMPPAAGSSSRASGIQDSGLTVGTTIGSDGASSAFFWLQGALTPLGVPPGGVGSAAVAVNPQAQVAGTSTGRADGSTFSFIRDSSGTWTPFRLAGFDDTRAASINILGHVAGTATTHAGAQVAFFFDGATATALPGIGPTSAALGISPGDQIVGTSGRVAALWERGAVRDLNKLADGLGGVTLTQATGISELGQIVANGHDAAGVAHAVLLTPTDKATPCTTR